MTSTASGDPVADRFTITEERGCIVVVPAPEIESIQWDMIDAASTRILAAAQQLDPPRLMFDMGRVEYFGSVFISLLLRCWKNVGATGNRFAICSVSPNLREVFFISRMHQLWDFHPDRETAFRALEADPAQ
jgi:anti-anti-sigma factor